MALTLTHTTPSNIALTNAYHKVTKIRWHSTSEYIDIEVRTYPTKADADNGMVPADKRGFQRVPFDKSAVDNAHTQAYTHLKTLPEFSSGVDA